MKLVIEIDLDKGPLAAIGAMREGDHWRPPCGLHEQWVLSRASRAVRDFARSHIDTGIMPEPGMVLPIYVEAFVAGRVRMEG